MNHLLKFINITLILFMYLTSINKNFAQETLGCGLEWGELSSIPDAIGYAGSFAGVSHGTLLVAGGANFPDGGAPWTGSVKKWYDTIYALEPRESNWKQVGKLPLALGYGVSVSWDDGLVCIGGSNEHGHYADAFIVRYKDAKISIEYLPATPEGIANLCGVLVGSTVYVAGGTANPDSKESEGVFWCLDLSKSDSERKWEILPSWPGPSRILGVAGTQGEAFYLFSGANLKDGKREYLKDAYKYTPENGWVRLKDLPSAVVAAPSTAYTHGDNLLIFGGDNGKDATIASELKEKHPGFSKDVLAYNTIADTWSVFGEVKTDIKDNAELNPNGSLWAPVTTPLVVWNEKIVLPGGEVRPATRTPRVLIASFK